ncbi:hypothetical protein AGMMS49593_00600 [Endomicrobiia bacterium]|nr:hypothetical protein AGMMS49593_00600 [Endomicrobiia bacterium]
MRRTRLGNSGQSSIEALFVVVFTTIIMFAFIQICIITVDDMIANEAAFVAMRSAAVTESNLRAKEAEDKTKTYLRFFYPLSSVTSNLNPSHFVLSSKQDVVKYFKKDGENSEEVIIDNDYPDSENKSVSIWKGKKTSKDYCGKNIAKETVKIHYFTRVLFGKVLKNNLFKNRRYQSSRNRMVPSPDEKYYFKAFPGAKSFEK